jgi:hypothetical protein
MKTELKQMIGDGVISEMEVVDFIRTLKKLSNGKLMDKRNVKMVVKHLGMKKKKGWLKIEKGNKIEL